MKWFLIASSLMALAMDASSSAAQPMPPHRPQTEQCKAGYSWQRVCRLYARHGRCIALGWGCAPVRRRQAG